MSASIFSKTSVTSSTTEVFDNANVGNKTLILENGAASIVWFAFDEAAVLSDGFSLAATGDAGSKIILFRPDGFPNVLNAISASATGNVSYSLF
jgi:hypothetical protein